MNTCDPGHRQSDVVFAYYSSSEIDQRMISHSNLNTLTLGRLATELLYGNLHVVFMKSGIAVRGQRLGVS